MLQTWGRAENVTPYSLGVESLGSRSYESPGSTLPRLDNAATNTLPGGCQS